MQRARVPRVGAACPSAPSSGSTPGCPELGQRAPVPQVGVATTWSCVPQVGAASPNPVPRWVRAACPSSPSWGSVLRCPELGQCAQCPELGQRAPVLQVGAAWVPRVGAACPGAPSWGSVPQCPKLGLRAPVPQVGAACPKCGQVLRGVHANIPAELKSSCRSGRQAWAGPKNLEHSSSPSPPLCSVEGEEHSPRPYRFGRGGARPPASECVLDGFRHVYVEFPDAPRMSEALLTVLPHMHSYLQTTPAM